MLGLLLLFYEDGEKRYILQPNGLTVGTTIIAGPDAPIEDGNALPLSNIPLGTSVHNVEMTPGKGGQIVRAAGASSASCGKRRQLCNSEVTFRRSSVDSA